MVRIAFQHVRIWVFDLDNTLYPPEARLFEQIERRMTAYVARELLISPDVADSLRAAYWNRYGTTLAGLMAEHGIDPLPFLEDVHDIDLSLLAPDPVLADRIRNLPGRKVVYTNGSEAHANRILSARGLTTAFDAVYGIEQAGFVPKPEAAAFATVFAQAGVIPSHGAMFEDDHRNLAVPHALGMQTVLVGAHDHDVPHVHHKTSNLSAFLSQLV